MVTVVRARPCGLGGFVLLAVSELDGELEQAVETTAREEWCRSYGVAARPHGRRVCGCGTCRRRAVR